MNVQTQLLGARIEMKSRGDEHTTWTDTRDSSIGSLIGTVRTVAASTDGVIILQIEDAEGWVHTRSSTSHLFRVLETAGTAALQRDLRSYAAAKLGANAKVKHLKVGEVFKFVPPLPGWFNGKLVVVEIPPGWAMAEGYDFFAIGTTESEIISEATVQILNEKAPMPSGLAIPEGGS